MSHVHDHGAMMMSTTGASMDHNQHLMDAMKISTGHGSNMKDMMMMAMTFHGGYEEQILFDQWNTKTVGAFVASWFAVFLLAVFYEALKTLRDYLSRRDAIQRASSQTTSAQNQTLLPSDDQDLISTPQTYRARLLSGPHLIQTFLHIIQMALSYLLMLIAMTYNTYLFFGVVLGAGLGHLLFACFRSSVIDPNEHCH